jgi:hypothetical protein
MSKIAVVTGASQGLGFALAEGLSQELAPADSVYLTGRDPDRVEAAAARIAGPRRAGVRRRLRRARRRRGHRVRRRDRRQPRRCRHRVLERRRASGLFSVDELAGIVGFESLEDLRAAGGSRAAVARFFYGRQRAATQSVTPTDSVPRRSLLALLPFDALLVLPRALHISPYHPPVN